MFGRWKRGVESHIEWKEWKRGVQNCSYLYGLKEIKFLVKLLSMWPLGLDLVIQSSQQF